jgi:hypothetical protein
VALAPMHELFRSGAAGDRRDLPRRFYVHGTKGFAPATRQKEQVETHRKSQCEIESDPMETN